MDVTAKCEGKELEFQLQGELDHHGAKGLLTCLEREIERTLPMVLVLDFSGVTFMDSSGIAVALRGWQRMRELGGSILLRHVSPQPRRATAMPELSMSVTPEKSSTRTMGSVRSISRSRLVSRPFAPW